MEPDDTADKATRKDLRSKYAYEMRLDDTTDTTTRNDLTAKYTYDIARGDTADTKTREDSRSKYPYDIERGDTADKTTRKESRSKYPYDMEPDDTADKAASQDIRSKPTQSDKEVLRRGSSAAQSQSKLEITADHSSSPEFTRNESERLPGPKVTSPTMIEQKSQTVDRRFSHKFDIELSAKIDEVAVRKSSGFSPNDMEIFKRPMCLIGADQSNTLTINKEVVSQLEMIDWPMVVISVVGLYRTGKSYLMNRLAGSTEGFALGDSIESKTKGIWAWCRIHPEMTNTVLLLLDTEGLGDPEKGDPSHDNKIFTLATLLCNCLVYNMKGAFDQDAVNKLTFVTEMASNIRYRGKSSEDNQMLNLILPDFVLCVRDFSLKLSKNGKQITEDKYLEQSLAEKLNQPRECIRKYFPKRKCFTFPVPGDGDILENLETLRFDQLSDKFKEAVKCLTSYIYGRKPKELVTSKPVNGLMFATLANHYVTDIRHGAVPDVDDAFFAVAKIENAKIQKESLEIFESQMGKILLPVSASQLEKCFTRAQQEALDYLRKNVVHDEDGTFENDAQMKMDTFWNGLRKRNLARIKEICQTKLHIAYSRSLKENIENKFFEIAGGFRKFQREVEVLKEEYFSSLRDFKEIEVVWPWLDFVNKTKGTVSRIIQADETIAEKEKEDEKKQIEQTIQNIEEQLKTAIVEAHRQQKKKMNSHYEQICQGRIKQMKTEANNFAAFAEEKLTKETFQRELARIQREKKKKYSQKFGARVFNVSLDDHMEEGQLKRKLSTKRKSRKQNNKENICSYSLEARRGEIKILSDGSNRIEPRNELKSEDAVVKDREDNDFNSKGKISDEDENPENYVHTENEPLKQAAEQFKPLMRTYKQISASDSDVQIVKRNRHTKQRSVACEVEAIDQGNTSDSGDDLHAKDERNRNEEGRSENNRSYKIDKQKWWRCIDTKDIQEADHLVNEKILPDQEMLDRATDKYGLFSEIVQKICDHICCNMKANVPEIVNVYPAIDYRPKSTRKHITFCIFTAQPMNIDIQEYRCFTTCQQEKTSSHSDENMIIKELEEVYQKDLSETEKVRDILKKRSKSLMEKHSNITRITISWVKSKGYGTENHSKEKKTCIAVYVVVKGFVPLNEEMLPKTIDGMEIDVREGFGISYTGPNEHHEHLKMGCAIHCGLRSADGDTLGGTLGGFFEIDGQLYCISCAHIFFSPQDMNKLNTNGLCVLGQDIKRFKARQPIANGSQAFGEGIKAVFNEGGNGATGVDAVMIKMEKRLPISGEFPESTYKGNAGIQCPTFTTGSMYNREKVDELVRSRKLTVVKFGWKSGWTRGTFRFDGGSVRLRHLVTSNNTFEYLLHNQFEIEKIGKDDFATNGDSGALVFTDENNQLSVIGVVEGGMLGTVYVTPIFEVFFALGLPGVHSMKVFPSMENQNIPIQSAAQVSTQTQTSRSDGGITEVQEELNTLRSDVTSKIECAKRELKNAIEKSNAELKQLLQNLQKMLTDKTANY